MFTRAAALLVLLASLLQASPAAGNAVVVGQSTAVVSVRAERQRERQLRRGPRRATRPPAFASQRLIPPAAFAGYSTPHFQRPPPFFS